MENRNTDKMQDTSSYSLICHMCDRTYVSCGWCAKILLFSSTSTNWIRFKSIGCSTSGPVGFVAMMRSVMSHVVLKWAKVTPQRKCSIVIYGINSSSC